MVEVGVYWFHCRRSTSSSALGRVGGVACIAINYSDHVPSHLFRQRVEKSLFDCLFQMESLRSSWKTRKNTNKRVAFVRKSKAVKGI